MNMYIRMKTDRMGFWETQLWDFSTLCKDDQRAILSVGSLFDQYGAYWFLDPDYDLSSDLD